MADISAERRKVIQIVNGLMRQFTFYFDKIRDDKVIRELFPQTWVELMRIARGRSIDREPTPLNESVSVDIIQGLLLYYEKFNNDLIRAVRSEKHDHHGLHKVLEELIKSLRWLLDYTK